MTEQKLSRMERLKAWSESPPPAPKARPAGSKPALVDRLADWAANAPLIFEGVKLEKGRISYKGQYQKAAGVKVIVESAGELQRRSTLTRTAVGALAFGPAGAVVGALFQKRVDERELYLLIDGETLAWAVPVAPSKSAAARAFAAKVNSASK